MVTPTQQRENFRFFGPYLHASIDVMHRTFGRGTLIGLPSAEFCDERPKVQVRIEDPEHPAFPDYYDLADCQPILYAPEDMEQVLLNNLNTHEASWDSFCADYTELAYMAELVDYARGLGIALNMPEGSYVRKPLEQQCKTPAN